MGIRELWVPSGRVRLRLYHRGLEKLQEAFTQWLNGVVVLGNNNII